MSNKYTLRIRRKPAKGRGASVSTVVITGGYTGGGNAPSSTAPDLGGTAPSVPDSPVVSWRLVPQPSTVKVPKQGGTSEVISCYVECLVNGKAVRLESAEDMAYQQVKLWYRVDSGKWKPYDIGLSEELETEDLDIFEAEDDDFFFTEGNNVPAAGVMDRVQFKLTDKEGERVYASVTVPVVRDGEAGADGAVGPMVYPAGTYDPAVTYDATGNSCPVVLYESQFYILRQGFSYKGNSEPTYKNPQTAQAAGYKWTRFDSYQAIFTDILMANFAKLSKAVFWGDFMFSEYGIDDSGQETDSYEQLTIVNDRITDAWVPNWWVDLSTGECFMRKATVRGHIDATSGKIGAFEINSGQLVASSSNNGTLLLGEGLMQVSTGSGNNTSSVALGRGHDEALWVQNTVSTGTVKVMRVEASGGTYQHAIMAYGAVNGSGPFQGYGCVAVTTTNGAKTSLTYSHDTVIVTSSTGGNLILPPRGRIPSFLGLATSNTPYAVRLTIIASQEVATPFVVHGRDSVAGTSTSYPQFIDNAGNVVSNGISMSKGNVLILLLRYDGSTYCAYIISHLT